MNNSMPAQGAQCRICTVTQWVINGQSNISYIGLLMNTPAATYVYVHSDTNKLLLCDNIYTGDAWWPFSCSKFLWTRHVPFTNQCGAIRFRAVNFRKRNARTIFDYTDSKDCSIIILLTIAKMCRLKDLHVIILIGLALFYTLYKIHI